ncbi:hypothetical protein SAMN05660991_04088 [Trujillonella endophytica]|uniref:Sugar transferase n=1 Tax=Trujillonella endophytica TaxID=673521 RepID=A0A1H8W5J7_9ACTN|nr:hypothetical protein SAMN05660991_04088 [Trujillella endophytica]
MSEKCPDHSADRFPVGRPTGTERMDVSYVANGWLTFDLLLLVTTIGAVVRGSDAH